MYLGGGLILDGFIPGQRAVIRSPAIQIDKAQVICCCCFFVVVVVVVVVVAAAATAAVVAVVVVYLHWKTLDLHIII